MFYTVHENGIVPIGYIYKANGNNTILTNSVKRSGFQPIWLCLAIAVLQS